MTDNSAAIKRQVEFYFSDANYRRDTFLKAAAESDPNGFIQISILLTFNKMKSIATSVEEISAALENSTIVTLNEDKTKLKKTTALPEEDTSKPRTVYAKGYPLDDESITIESITEQFSTYGQVSLVKLRRDDHKKFKGSCFIEFTTEEDAKKCVLLANENNMINIKYKDTPLVCVMLLTEWLHRKEEKDKKRKAETLKLGSYMIHTSIRT